MSMTVTTPRAAARPEAAVRRPARRFSRGVGLVIGASVSLSLWAALIAGGVAAASAIGKAAEAGRERTAVAGRKA